MMLVKMQHKKAVGISIKKWENLYCWCWF